MPDAVIHTAAWLVNPDVPPLEKGALLVHNGRIEATGSLSDLTARYSVPVTEHADAAIIPGFVNAHTHLELTNFPAWREKNGMGYSPRRFVDWIIQLVKITRRIESTDFTASLSAGISKCISSGTTTIGDILTRYNLLPTHLSSPAASRIYFEVLGHESSHFAPRLADALHHCKSLAGDLHRPALSPHAPYTLGEDPMGAVAAAIRQNGLPVSLHLSESSAEVEFVFDSTGQIADELYPFVGWEQFLMPPRRVSSTTLLDRSGLLTPSTMAVHCVHVTLDDARILKERGCSICLCPRSNEILDVGKAPVALFKKLGIPLALGTDSLASNNSLSLWDEMRFALDAFPRELSPADALRMATTGGAAALGLSGDAGSLAPGRRADFQVIRNIGCGENGLLERMIRQGTVEDVYCSGTRYTSA